MNLKHLRAFREVMTSGSVSEAARRLHRSQPAVSAMISALEEDLGLNLFIRQGKRLRPAPEANYLLRETDAILRRVENMRRTMDSVRHTRDGQLNIVSMPGPSVYFLPRLISEFARDRPGLGVTLITRPSRDVEQTISAQSCDIGFADYDMLAETSSSLVTHHLHSLECYCAMPATDPLARRDTIHPDDLDGSPLATLYPEHPTTLQTVDAFRIAGASINPVFRAQYFIALLPMVEQGVAYSIVDALSIRGYQGQNPETARRLVFRRFRPKVVLKTTVMVPDYRPGSLVADAFFREFNGRLTEITQSRAA